MAEIPVDPATFRDDKFITPTDIQRKPLSELLDGLIGTIDSGVRDENSAAYGESLEDKFAKQGIHLPRDQRM